MTTKNKILNTSITSHSFLFLCVCDENPEDLFSALSNTQYQLLSKSPCYTLDPQDLLFI